jgi:hypothetical protein
VAFFTPIGVIYGLITNWDEPVGTCGIFLVAALSGLIGLYLYLTSRRIDDRPEDDPEGEIAQGAGELGFFPPYSWWPLPLAVAAAMVFLGIAVGWWLFIIGAGAAVIALVGWVFEYYRGAHAH